MSTDTLMIPRSPVGPPPGSPAIKKTKIVMTADKINTKKNMVWHKKIH